MAPSPAWNTLITAVALATTIMLLGSMYLLILRAPRIQFSLRFLLTAIACVSVVLGAWAAVLRTAGVGRGARPGIEWDGEGPAPATSPHPNAVPTDAPKEPPGRMLEYNEYMDGPYRPQPIAPATQPGTSPKESPGPAATPDP